MVTTPFDDYPLLVLLAPLAAALLTALPGSGPKRYKIGALAHIAAFGIALQLLYAVAGPEGGTIRLPLFASAWRFLSIELAIDRLAAVMMVVITTVGALLYLYSLRFMQEEEGRARFHTLLSLSIFALLCMVSSANLAMLFLFWQLLGWLLSLLSHNYAHPPTAQGAFRTFIMQRAGDIAFLAGIVLAYHLYGTVDFQPLFTRAAADRTTLSLFWPGSGLAIGGATAVTLLIFIGAMSKSAQFPFHMWLPDSLYAPTTVTALLHAGMINAGGFLLNRLAPLYGLSPTTLRLVFAVGLLTTLLGSSMMLTQNDIKKTLGYSTIGQMGYMIMECGLGAFALAIFHLIAHGLFKATIFLNCGNVIHAARQDPRVPKKEEAAEPTQFSSGAWVTGFVTTLAIPLAILLGAHGILQIPLTGSQGIVIFLFFSWVTSAQAILTLYRLRAAGSSKVVGIMLLTLALVMSTYLFAAERFTHFLYPAPGDVAFYFQAAALPARLFDALIGATALSIMLGWFFIYAKNHGRTISIPGAAPERISGVQARLYLFFMNRLYLDALAFRLSHRFRRGAERLDRSRFFLPAAALIALAAASPSLVRASEEPIEKIFLFVPFALMLPLFPFHGVYVAALSRLPRERTGSLSVALAILLPMAGLYGLTGLLPDLSPELLEGVGVLALFGAIYGSIKTLVQVKVPRLLAYGSLALYSILWRLLATAGRMTAPAAVYTAAAAIATGGLLLAWDRVRARYGDLDLNRIGGLAGPMPRLATLLALLVMAAAGLPPFGLFSGFMEMLLNGSASISAGLIIILLTCFTASWRLFKLMQRLLFGPHRTDLLYEDLRPVEIVPLVIALIILLALGIAPYGWLEGAGTSGALMEIKWTH